MTDLKPCPFCGGTATFSRGEDGKDTEPPYVVACESPECPVVPFTIPLDTEAEAIAAWNRRAPLTRRSQ